MTLPEPSNLTPSEFADRPSSDTSVPAGEPPTVTHAGDAELQTGPYLGSDQGSSLPGSSSSHRLSGSFGPYQLLGEIAKGGMGVVYRARHQALNRVVALKMIRSGELAEGDELHRFRAEARAAGRLDHPGIVPVFEVGEHNGQHYYTMGFVEGGSLSARIRKQPMPPRDAARIVEQVARAVGYAHQHGVIHRDLKPANILLDSDGNPRVTDFGLARQVESESHLTVSGQVLGTPSFMPPEQAAGRPELVGPAADIYSLGAVLYNVLTGRPPFQAATMLETLQQVQQREPVAPRQLNPAVPRDLETICLKCLRKEPHRRYPTAEALADELARFLAGTPIQARPIGLIERSWRWCWRYPAAAGLLLSLTLGILAAIGLTVWALGERDRANVKAIEAAESARNEAQHRRTAENELAQSLIAAVRESRATAQPGWTWNGLEKLQNARKLQTDNLDPVEFRTLLADCLGRPDLRPVGVLAEGIDPATLAFRNDGRFLAVAQRRSAAICSVQVYDMQTRRLAVTCAFATLVSSFERLAAGDTRYQDGVSSLVFSPDGKWLVAGTRQGRLCRWDLTAARPEPLVWQNKDAKVSVDYLAFSPDGRHLISATRQQVMRWEVENEWKGTEIAEGVLPAALSPDGSVLALGTNQLQLLVGPEWKPRETSLEFHAHRLGFSPDGRLLVAQSADQIHFVDVATGERRRTIRVPTDAVGVTPNGIQFSVDGSLLVTAYANHRVYLWDVASTRLLAELFIADREDPIPAFSPDGRHLVLVADRRTLLYELRTTDVQTTLAHQPNAVKAIDFTPEGELVCASEQVSGGVVYAGELSVWDAVSGQRRRVAKLHTLVGNRGTYIPLLSPGTVTAAPDGATLVSASSIVGAYAVGGRSGKPSHSLLEYPVATGSMEIPRSDWRLEGTGVEERDDPQASDGRAVRIPGTSAGAGVRFQIPELYRKSKYDVWYLLASLRIEQPNGADSPFVGSLLTSKADWNLPAPAAVPRDEHYHLYQFQRITEGEPEWFEPVLEGKLSVPSPAEGLAAIWVDRMFLVPGLNRQPPFREPSRPDLLCYAPRGQRLWGVYGEDTVVSWKSSDFKVATRWRDGIGEKLFGLRRIRSLGVGDAWVLAGNDAGVVVVLDASTGTPTVRRNGPGGSVRALALDPTETRAILGTQKGSLQVLRLPDATPIAVLPPHSQSVESIAFSRDGQLLATGSLDQTIRLWRPTEDGFQLLMMLPAQPGQLASIRFSPDGSKLAVLNRAEHAARVWNLDRLRSGLRSFGVDW